ncbi:hypothetical protein SCH4B_2631 [Ruegeria sp. TrichCH4B]|nr:hypothetical protein SCH4B_2631 [Ruegeria sp. TrichCH4B]
MLSRRSISICSLFFWRISYDKTPDPKEGSAKKGAPLWPF